MSASKRDTKLKHREDKADDPTFKNLHEIKATPQAALTGGMNDRLFEIQHSVLEDLEDNEDTEADAAQAEGPTFRVASTLLSRRDAVNSRFLGSTFTTVPLNEHTVINCPLPSRFDKIVNGSVKSITAQMKANLVQKHRQWVQDGRRGGKPALNIYSWLALARRVRVLSLYPQLDEIKDTKELELSGQENQKMGWVKLQPNHPYELQECNSPYEKHISDICRERNSPKIAAVNELIGKRWDTGEKAVFCCMGPTSALIFYWYIRLVLKARVALIFSGMPKSKTQNIVWMFQEREATTKANPGIEPPQYLVGTTAMIGVGYNLTKARRLVQMEPEWFDREQKQAKRIINRIGAIGITSTYSLVSTGSTIEEAINDRQGRRKPWLDLTLDPDKFDDRVLKHRTGVDEEDIDDDYVAAEDMAGEEALEVRYA